MWVKDFLLHKKGERKMTQKKNLKKYLIAGLVLIVVVAAMALLYHQFRPQVVQGSKKIVVEVVIPKEKSKDFTIHTDAEYLGQALDEQKLVEGKEGDYGLFITKVNGRTADDSKKEWWCITKDNNQVNTSADKTPIANGDHFEITLTTGY